MFKIEKIAISTFHWVVWSQLLLLCSTEATSANNFRNEAIDKFCYKRLRRNFYVYIVLTFYVYLLSVTNRRSIEVIKYDSF